MKRAKIEEIKTAYEQVETLAKELDNSSDIEDAFCTANEHKDTIADILETREIELETTKKKKEESVERMLVRISYSSQWVKCRRYNKCEFSPECDSSRGKYGKVFSYRPKAVASFDELDLVLCHMCVLTGGCLQAHIERVAYPYYSYQLRKEQTQRANDPNQWAQETTSARCKRCKTATPEPFMLKKEVNNFNHKTYNRWVLCTKCFHTHLSEFVTQVKSQLH